MAILYTAVYSLGYDGSLLNGIQALKSWNRDFVRSSAVTELTSRTTHAAIP